MPSNSRNKKSTICLLCLGDRFKGFKLEKKSIKTSAEQHHKFLLHNEMLPVWYDKNDIKKRNPKYHIPKELQDLTESEVLLIQRYSAYIPVFHMSKGQTGLKGHCVCFIQDINSVCNDLPRKKCNVV